MLATSPGIPPARRSRRLAANLPNVNSPFWPTRQPPQPAVALAGWLAKRLVGRPIGCPQARSQVPQTARQAAKLHVLAKLCPHINHIGVYPSVPPVFTLLAPWTATRVVKYFARGNLVPGADRLSLPLSWPSNELIEADPSRN